MVAALLESGGLATGAYFSPHAERWAERVHVRGAEGEALASIGPLELLGSPDVDPAQVAERIEERRAELRSEVERGERKLANQGFVAKAPAEVVESEREKLAGYRAELAELER